MTRPTAAALCVFVLGTLFAEVSAHYTESLPTRPPHTPAHTNNRQYQTPQQTQQHNVQTVNAYHSYQPTHPTPVHTQHPRPVQQHPQLTPQQHQQPQQQQQQRPPITNNHVVPRRPPVSNQHRAAPPARAASVPTAHSMTRVHSPQQSTAQSQAARKRFYDDQARKHAEKQRQEMERKRQLEEKRRQEEERQRVEAAERQRVEQTRVQAEQDRQRVEDEHRRKAEAEAHARQLAHTQQAAAMQAHAVNVHDPRNHYSAVPLSTHLSTSVLPSSVGSCDIPPDLWCDSREAAQACGVEKQCANLKRRGRPLKITLVYEALCPFCKRFIANQLGAVYDQLHGVFELELLPWGNGRILPDGSFSCNHGQRECDANRMQSCVLDVLQVRAALPFIVCFEKNIFGGTVDNAMRQCSAFIRSHEREIKQCYDGERGIQLQRIAAQKTFAARPQPIMEVPYLLINDYSPTTDNNDMNILLFPQMISKWSKVFAKK